MKKAMILTGFNPRMFTGGIETFTAMLIGLLSDHGIDVDLACAADAGNDFAMHNGFVGRVYAAGRHLLDLPANDYDFVISNGYYGGGYFPKHLKTFTIFHSTHAGYAEAVRRLVPLSGYLEIRHVIGGLLERSSAAGAKIIAVSDLVRAELAGYYGLADVEVIPNPVDTSFFFKLDDRDGLRHKYGVRRHKQTGLFVGRWERSKGNDVAERLIRELPDTDWIIAASSGGQPVPTMENVRNFEGLDRSGMRELYSLADFMVFPSCYEGFGLAAAEAMACGLPVIGSPVGFLRSLYERPPFSHAALPAATEETETIVRVAGKSIESLMSDDSLRADISLKGTDIVRENFDVSLWKDRMRSALCLN